MITLALVTYSYDVLSNRKIPFSQAKWAALLINVHYQPFFQKRFGVGKFYWLSKGLHSSDGGRMLWVIPLTDSNSDAIRRWYQADLALDDFLYASYQGVEYFWGSSSDRTRQILENAYPFFQGDPFLESCFREKMADQEFKNRHFEKAIESLQRAVDKGYPATHLFYRLGVLNLIQGKSLQARQAFQKATRAPFDFTDSEQMLKQLPASQTTSRGKIP